MVRQVFNQNIVVGQLIPNQQDKRSVVPIGPENVNTWLAAPVAQAAQLVQLADVGVFVAKAVAVAG